MRPYLGGREQPFLSEPSRIALKGEYLINFFRVDTKDIDPWFTIQEKVQHLKAVIFITGDFRKGAKIGHGVAVNFQLGENGVIFDGCHKHHKNGAVAAYNFDLPTAYSFLQVPRDVHIYFLSK